jgi:KipI family sensor histidine kinase inhibitor
VGDAAVTVELGAGIDPDLAARVRALDRSLSRAPFPGFRESVPTYRSLLVLYDPGRIRFADVRAVLLARAAEPVPREEPGPLRCLPVLYGGEAGPDLADVARACRLSEAEVVARHSATEYTAFMLGFTPGFAYLGPLPEALSVPRLATPRVRVPAGSVAIAGGQTAVYPAATPGGWRLIGRTSLLAFDPFRDPPALLVPGDRVRFEPVDALPDAALSEPPPSSHESPTVEVLEPGLLTLVQDGGRHGLRRYGVAASGVLDGRGLRAANRMLGNPEDDAALECTVAGPTLRFLRPVRFAIAGADLGAVLQRPDLGDWDVPMGAAVLARAGNVLRFTGRRGGARAVVAFGGGLDVLGGGLDVPFVLGSRATDLAAGFGGFAGRALRAGDLLSLGPAPEPSTAPATWTRPSPSVTLRVVLGPQYDHFPPGEVERFLRSSFGVSALSDRAGCRLEGPRLAAREGEITTDGMVPGSIQVPPDGNPILMLADGPTTGGYPKIATVLTRDLPLVAQLVPGQGEVRFSAVSVEEAQRGA